MGVGQGRERGRMKSWGKFEDAQVCFLAARFLEPAGSAAPIGPPVAVAT